MLCCDAHDVLTATNHSHLVLSSFRHGRHRLSGSSHTCRAMSPWAANDLTRPLTEGMNGLNGESASGWGGSDKASGPGCDVRTVGNVALETSLQRLSAKGDQPYVSTSLRTTVMRVHTDGAHCHRRVIFLKARTPTPQAASRTPRMRWTWSPHRGTSPPLDRTSGLPSKAAIYGLATLSPYRAVLVPCRYTRGVNSKACTVAHNELNN